MRRRAGRAHPDRCLGRFDFPVARQGIDFRFRVRGIDIDVEFDCGSVRVELLKLLLGLRGVGIDLDLGFLTGQFPVDDALPSLRRGANIIIDAEQRPLDAVRDLASLGERSKNCDVHVRN